ncbi:hypothetical protein BVY03_00745, partial [bacterium K02(2017)]
MQDYLLLTKKLWPLNRAHLTDDTQDAFKQLQSFYTGSQIIKHKSGFKCGAQNTWTVPEKWVVHHATLKDSKGTLIADFKESPLRLYSYSPSFSGTIDKKTLINDHVFSQPDQPDAIPFHFRNQYRPWDRQWGFCLKDNEVKKLNDINYQVDIKTEFIADEMFQLEYEKPGKSKKRILLLGHFDHPDMGNDGLLGCMVANEVIKRLKNKETYYSYAALSTVEIIGSVAYCQTETENTKNTVAGLFITLPSTPNHPISYQNSSSPQNFIIDRAFNNLLRCRYPQTKFFDFRSLIGNDEIAFESPGISINMGLIGRLDPDLPFPHYHNNSDDINKINETDIENMINLVIDLITIIENNYKVSTNFTGLPCLSHPKFNLFLHPIDQYFDKTKNDLCTNLISKLHPLEIKQLTQTDKNKLYFFSNQIIPYLGQN